MKRTVLLCLIFLFLFADISVSQVLLGDKGSISGRVYTDYYWMAQHHDPDIEGENGFWFRRIYMTYNRNLDNGFSSRLRLAMSSSGDFTSDNKMTPVVKDAYLQWKNEHHRVIAGISGTPTFGVTEDVWGYRSIEKAPQDLYDYGSSRDFGLAFKGRFGEAEKLGYHFFVGNGNSNGSEFDKGKKVMLAVNYNLTEYLIVEGYGDYHSRTDDLDSYTGQLFGGYQSDALNIGALYSYQYREGTLGFDSRDLDLVSFFTNFNISEHTKGYFRADHFFDGYQGGSDNSYLPFAEEVESTFLVGGADIMLSDTIHLMPNIEAIVYGENNQGISPDNDVIPRMTLFWEF